MQLVGRLLRSACQASTVADRFSVADAQVGAASTVPPEGGKRGGKQQGARGSRPIGTDNAGVTETVEVDVGVAAATV